MEKDSTPRTITERIKRRLGLLAGNGIFPETGRSWAEERMIERMEKKGGAGFTILRSAETGLKKYTRLQ